MNYAASTRLNDRMRATPISCSRAARLIAAGKERNFMIILAPRDGTEIMQKVPPL
jgi:hypothetical protein